MSLTATLFRLLGSIAGAVLPKSKQIYAERSAGRRPESTPADHTEEILDEALGRLGAVDLDHPWWKRALVELGAAAMRPDWFKKPHVQDWLAQCTVQRLLKVAARAKLTGAAIHRDDYEELIESYMSNSDEDRQHAESVISLAVAVLAASIHGAVRDTGTAAIVQAAARDQRDQLVVMGDTLDAIAVATLGSAASGGAGRSASPDDATVEVWREELKRASQDLLAWPTTLARKEWIPRPELDQILSIIDGSEFSATALLGQPGSGKSALMAVLGKQLQDERGWTVLAVKADLLDVEVVTETNLQGCLDLPEKPSVMLQRLAERGPVVLVIDQLDALASYLDVRTGRLSALLNLVRRVGRINKIHVVLSSRTFEFNHDVRLRAIDAKSVTLEAPAWAEVAKILEANGVLAAGWPADAQEVMRYPQALNTYLQLKERGASESFTTYQEMLDRLWSERVLHGETGPRRARLASEIANSMAEEESLWLARARFDHQAEDIQMLVASGVLTSFGSEGSLGFTHQTLFEYALARSFAQEKGRLSTYVLDRQQSLFVRPKLWAALNYLRTAELAHYESELGAIWSAPGLRKHLRFLLIDFLGQQASPTDQEALLLEHAIRNPEERALVFKAIGGSPGWFSRFAEGFVAEAMAQDGVLADLTISVLASAWPYAPETVLRLMNDRWAVADVNDRRSWLVLQNAPMWSDGMLAMARRVVARTDISPFHIDSVVATLGVTQPKMAMELVRAYLDRALDIAVAKAAQLKEEIRPTFGSVDAEIVWDMKSRPKRPIEDLLGDTHQWESLPALAESAPFLFLELLWPWYLSIFESLRLLSTEEPTDLGFPLSYGVDFRFEGETSFDLQPPALIAALVAAVEHAARTDPGRFLTWESTASAVELAPVQRLIAHGLSIDAAGFAQRALDFVLNDARRFHLGSYEDIGSTTKALVMACASNWSEADVKRFEDCVLAYKPPTPARLTEAMQRRSWIRMIRRTQVELLRALPSRARSDVAQRRVVEESRVFPETHIGVNGGVRSVGSIMDAAAIGRASDEAVLSAFQELPDSTGWGHPRHWGKGGNIQLARAFADFAKTAPARAQRLIAQFAPGTGERAAGYAVDAIAEAGEPALVSGLVLDLAKRGFDGQEFRVSTARAIERLVDRRIPIGDEVIAMLDGWLLVEAVDESANKNAAEGDGEVDTAATEQPVDDDAAHESLLWGHGGISFQPGGDYPVLEALVRARLARHESDQIIDSLTAYLQRSKDARIWENLLRVLVYLQPGTGDRRGEFFKALLRGLPQLTGSKASAYLLAHIHWYAPEVVAADLVRWKTWPQRGARQGFGELATLVALAQPNLDWPRDWLSEIETDASLVDARAGAAMSAVNLWVDLKHRAVATDLLVRLLATGEKGVWSAVFDLFRLVDELTPEDQTIRLLRAISKHVATAPRLSGTFVVERLGSLLPHEAELVGHISGGLVKMWRDQLSEVSTSTAIAAPELIDLAATLHRLGPATRELGLNLFEQLVEIDAYHARQMLDEIDNRFRDSAASARPRLRRRTRGGARRVSRPKSAA
jgi:hypothetical protein